MAKKEDPKKVAQDIDDSFSSLRDTLKSIGEELGINVNKITEAKKEYRSLLDIAKQLQNNEEEIIKLSDKQIKDLKSKSEANLRDLKITAEKLAKEKQISDISKVNLKTRKDLDRNERVLLSMLQEKFSVEEQIINQLQEEDKLREDINKKTGVTGILLKGMSKIPIVGELLKTDEALEAARNKARETNSAFQAMGAAFGSMGKSLLTSLSDPLVSIGLLVKVFKEFIDLGFAADTEITNMSKSMAISKEEAAGIRDRMIEIQNNSESLFMTTKNQVAAQLELADAFGATRGFTEKQIEDQVKLTKQIGLSTEEAAGLQQLAMSNGITAEQVTDSVIKQTATLAKQKGIQLDNKKIIGEVSKVSGQLRLQYANNPALIAKAVVQTQKLGVSLEQAKKAAEGLLNFEQSIEDELSAELLTGKNLNLERARSLALNGESAAAMEEIANQVGTAADFTKMNVIQQESLAKAVGMSADELANSLVARENLNKLGDQTKQQIEEQIELARQQGDMDKVNMLQRSIGNEDEAEKALERISAQETFNATTEKLKLMLSSIVEGPAADFVNWFGDAEKGADRLKGLFESIKTVISIVAGIIAGKMVFGLATSVGSMLAQVALSKKLKAAAQEQAVAEGVVTALKVTGAEASTLGAATPLILGGLAAVMAGIGAYSLMNDGIISPTGGMVVSGPEGSIQLNKKDSIIAGTNLFGGDTKSENKTTQTSGKGSINVNSNVDTTAIINAINALASRPINVSIDGKKVIEATTGTQPNTVGDESRKNSYKMS